MADEVNKKDPELTDLSWRAVKDKLDELMDFYRPTFSEYVRSQASGSNRFNSETELEAYRTYLLVIN